MREFRPPRFADWLIARVTDRKRREALMGDLHEQYQRGRSLPWYWRQTIKAIVMEMAVKERLLWVLIPTVATAALTATASHFFMPPRYQSDALVLVVPSRVPQSFVRSTVTSRIEHISRTLTSQILTRTRMERIIRELDLYSEHRVFGIQKAVERMRSSIDLNIMSADTFRVSFTHDEARTAMEVTDRLASLFTEEAARRGELRADNTRRFIDAQLEYTRGALVVQEAELSKGRVTTSGELSRTDVDYETLMKIYLSLLQKYEVARDADGRLGPEFRILDPAFLPGTPLGPSKARVNLGGALAGFALGLVMMGVSSHRKRSPSPIERGGTT